uniref:EF-hand domain-containing protein n=1 Tax=Attheya septentrionalis TaxID=420275 RepID=A0A7S2UGX4_9STRA|mmetsp:Transcript_24545/g.44398  ORF Transcript_24545/g.44398 Transcript_24545/m.44398 type:complete len:562 (+) Transcript_24545:278-1963(+)|eukprot:CAMPEP_0198297448 /NCGR_PEP_ID=MMETSP1449-20131203/36816_1 /TAXON_ID=420275 /ORGANISM="Attheya septentrionalis, Strain CCMP2084" /LENGTH=561 /DNA_ID=CAMNT_0043998369 /DNA_START=255 /DNA_END=1940 /DNA_ORIENTATION=+
MFPSVEPSEVGLTGLLWLFLSYGYVLYQASNLISEGSDLLMLVPSMAGLVGGVVLPLLGAVPDGAIMLFSGLGDIESAQETLSVGVGALAGSTIMLLTVPWAMSIFAGRVDNGLNGKPNYMGKPKLANPTSWVPLKNTGVALTEEVNHGATIMMITTIPYFIIQIPSLFLHGPTEEVAKAEKYWAAAGFFVCLIGFVSYLALQVQVSNKGMDRMKRVAVMKKLLGEGKLSLSGCLAETLKREEHRSVNTSDGTYQALGEGDSSILYPPPSAEVYLKEVLYEPFQKYDSDSNGSLEKNEFIMFLKDFHESITEEDVDELFGKYDSNGDGTISYEEFIGICYTMIMQVHSLEHASAHDDVVPTPQTARMPQADTEFATSILGSRAEDEEEEVPEDISSLSPQEQQVAIKKRAFTLLFIGTFLVILFSDPMVDVMQEIAVRSNLSPFYVSFILAPLASNASEVIASQYYASKKTRKTITVSLTALEGAASMNNTFCLSIFMGLIYFRGLAWQYTAETIAIVAVQFIMGFAAQSDSMSVLTGCFVLSIFPLSILFVATLEALGFD